MRVGMVTFLIDWAIITSHYTGKLSHLERIITSYYPGDYLDYYTNV